MQRQLNVACNKTGYGFSRRLKLSIVAAWNDSRRLAYQYCQPAGHSSLVSRHCVQRFAGSRTDNTMSRQTLARQRTLCVCVCFQGQSVSHDPFVCSLSIHDC